MNIFSTEYTINEIKKVKFHEYQNKEIKVFYKTLSPFSALDGYMGTRVENKKELQIPIFTIKDKIWMSCTPMEMSSHYVPIRKAKGKVGVAGLGMGYYILRIMNKKSVKSKTGKQPWENNIGLPRNNGWAGKINKAALF